MRQTLVFLLMTMAFPSAYAFCDNKPCDTPFLCYERELCRFKENAKSSIALTMKQLTREYQLKLTVTTDSLKREYEARLVEFEKQQRGDMTEALDLTKIARESFEQTQSSIAMTLSELTTQYQDELTAVTEDLIDKSQIRLNAYEQAYRQKMEAEAKKIEAEAKLAQLARESVEKDAQQVRLMLEQLSVARPWEPALSKMDDKLSNQIAAVEEKMDDKLSNQIAAVEENLSKKVDEQSSTVFQDRLPDGRLGPKMVRLPSNTFRMGDNLEHSVSVEKFAMGQYEVTVAEFRQFVNATGYKTDAEKGEGCYSFDGSSWRQRKDANWRNVYFSQDDTHPVVCVSWHDATAYVKWLSEQTGHQYRLPTEAQWEYAARAGTETQYWWGNEVGTNNANCYNCGSRWDKKSTAPVGSFAANPFGLFDTAGNLWEWTCSEYQNKYAGKEQQCADSAGFLVLRGGAWDDNAARTRSAYRDNYDPTNRYNNYGFRPARIR